MPKLEMIRDGHLGGYIRGGDPGTWCPNLWKWAVRHFDVYSVLDVGCGEGHSTRFFRDLGCEVEGVEGCEQALSDSVIPESVVQHDICKGPYLPSHSPDLIWACEFLEHVEKQYVGNILRTFCSARKAIVVTHAFPGQDRGHHHVNCRRSSYWIRRIEDLGFRCDTALTHRARAVTLQDYPGVNHFARSGLVFVRETSGTQQAIKSPVDSPGLFAHLQRSIVVEWKAFAINVGFALSPTLLSHRRRWRAMKRVARRQPAAE
jgi:hypothetical protein